MENKSQDIIVQINALRICFSSLERSKLMTSQRHNNKQNVIAVEKYTGNSKNNSERTRELGPEGPKLVGASSYSNACGQWLAKLDLLFNTHRHSFRTDISWSNMPLIMFMGADILFVYFLFRCQSSTSLASYWDRYSYRTFPVLSLSLRVGRTVDVYHYSRMNISPYDSSNCGYWQISLYFGNRIFIRLIFVLFKQWRCR